MAKSNFQDLNLIRRKNQMDIFSLLRKGEQSCVTLTESLNISKVAVYSVMEDLLGLNITKMQSDQSSKIGRKPAIYSLNAQFGLFAAVDFSKKYISVDLFDIFGKVVEHRNAKNGDYLDKSDIYDVVKILREMTNKHCNDNFPLRCICIATPGRINKSTGYFWIAARFRNPTEISLEKIFKESFDCSVIVQNDIVLAAIGINNHPDLKNIPNSLLLHIGSSMGAALYLNGKCYEGENNAACEFGSTLLFNREPITSKLSLANLLEKYERITGTSISDEKFKDLFLQGDTTAVQIFDEYIATLSVAINNILVMLDISTVIFSGNICAFGDRFLNRLQNHYLNASHFFARPRCLFSPLGDNAILAGCVETALTVGVKHILDTE